MAFSVTSSFTFEARSKTSTPIRKFTIAGSDYSSLVEKWPTFTQVWDEVRPKSLQMPIINGDGIMNFLRDDKTKMISDCLVQMGFSTNSGDELITLFSGKIGKVKYNKGKCTLTITDKFQQLSERNVGTSDDPVSYTGSNYLPSDIAWWVVTSYGGFSTVTSNNNPDIDYDAFSTWAQVFSADSVFMQGTFDGNKCTEVLRKLARQTHSAIYIDQNKLTFKRFGIADTLTSSLGPAEIKDLALGFSTTDLINKQSVSGDYDATSNFHKFTVTATNSTSVNSFGAKEDIIKDDNLWYVSSASALNLAQRKILTDSDPDDSINVESALPLVASCIGETIFVSDAFHGINESYRLLSKKTNMAKGIITADIDRTMITNSFKLDVTSLNSTTEVLI